MINPPDAPPIQVSTGSWKTGATPGARRTLTLDLTNVAALTVDARAAHLESGTATITTDDPTKLTLAHLKRGARTVRLAAGTTRISW